MDDIVLSALQLPPDGPAMPVKASAKSAPARSRAPSAMAYSFVPLEPLVISLGPRARAKTLKFTAELEVEFAQKIEAGEDAQVRLDEKDYKGRSEQIELQRKARTLEGLELKEERKSVLALMRNAQRLLDPVAIVNPYADRLTFTAERTRTRRDHEKYLTLIDTIALLHQRLANKYLTGRLRVELAVMNTAFFHQNQSVQ